MDAAVAHSIARQSYTDQRNRFDEPIIDHVERVAAAVPEDAQPLAYLHDVLERTSTGIDDLRAQGLSPLEEAALDLLTHRPGESYELHTLRIAWAAGPEGHLARTVKLADLDDHLAHAQFPSGAPPYKWGRRHIAVADKRLGDPAHEAA